MIPDDKTQVTAFSVIDNLLNEQLRVLINVPIKTDEIAPFQNVKKLYKACFNTDLIEERGMTPVLNILNDMGGWPVVMSNAWDTTNIWSWEKSVEFSKINGYSVSYFLSFSVSTDNKDTTRRIIRVIKDKKKVIEIYNQSFSQIDQASLGLSREYLIKNVEEPFVQAYHNYQVDLAVMFGADRALAEIEMKEALDFEIELAEVR